MWPIQCDKMEPYLGETFYPASYNNRKADYLYICAWFKTPRPGLGALRAAGVK